MDKDIKKYNLPPDMSKEDFKIWLLINNTIKSFEDAKMPDCCESYRKQRFDIINRYHEKRLLKEGDSK